MGSADGKVYIVSRRCLAMAVEAHAGPVLDLDAPGMRRLRSGTLLVSKKDGGKLEGTVRAVGAQTDAALGQLAHGAMKSLLKEHYRNAPHQTGRAEMEAHALVVWGAEDEDLFASGGADGVLRVWRFEPQLVVGPAPPPLPFLY